MSKMRFTDLAIKKLTPPPKPHQLDVFDEVLPGLYLKISYGGSKSFRVLYYSGNKPRTIKIGRYPIVTLEEARKKARDILKEVSEGRNPKARRPKDGDTIDAVVDLFIERYAKPKNRSWRETERILKKEFVSEWAGRPIGTITRQDVNDVLDAIVDRGTPYAANRAFAAARKMFRWAAQRGIIEHSPMVYLQAPGKEVSRNRYLSDDEIHAIWLAWNEALEWPWLPFFQVLLLTAQRRGEVAHMRWSDLNLGKKLWTLPREFAKNDQEHEVPLSESVLTILDGLPRFDGDFVFSTTGGESPLVGFQRPKYRTDEAIAKLAAEGECAAVAPWKIHDLRRSAATGMRGLGLAPDVISAVLNHSQSSLLGVGAVYMRHPFVAEKKDALGRWARHVIDVVQRPPSAPQSDMPQALDADNVIQFPGLPQPKALSGRPGAV